MRRAIPVVAAVLLAAGCASSSHSSTTSTPQTPIATATRPSPTLKPAVPAPTSPAAQPSSQPLGNGNFSLSPLAKQLPPGPFQITPVSCGPYTAAEQNQLGSNAKGGLVFRYTNESQSVSGEPALTVNFLSGSTVVGSNITGDIPTVSPGQSAEGYVDAIGGSGGDLTFASCELMEYALRGTADTTTYAP